MAPLLQIVTAITKIIGVLLSLTSMIASKRADHLEARVRKANQHWILMEQDRHSGKLG